MAKPDPHVVLGVDADASPTQVKAAWRRLARRHHPDLTGDDPEASRAATRQMAEINDAYAAMTRPDRAGRRRTRPAAWADVATEPTGGARQGSRRTGPPRPKPTRPVTGRLDLSGTVRPRNTTLRNGAEPASAATTLSGHPPLRFARPDREPPRASDPTGPPERSRIRGFRAPAEPPLEDAAEREIEFGKFRGHTLGEVADFEPSYIDWLARTITRDPDLVAAARVIRAELDRRGIPRRDQAPSRPGRPA